MEDELPKNKPVHWYRQRKPLTIVVLLFVLSLIALSGSQYIRATNLQADNKNKSNTLDNLKDDLKIKQARTTELESQTTDLNEKITVLEATLKGLKEGPGSDYKVPTYDLEINNVRAETIFVTGMEDENNKYLYVTVTVTNTSSSEGYISPLDFILKNSEGEKRPNYKEHSYYNSYYDKAGSVELMSQPLTGGDTTKGTLLFIVGKNDQGFTLRYNNETHNISPN